MSEHFQPHLTRTSPRRSTLTRDSPGRKKVLLSTLGPLVVILITRSCVLPPCRILTSVEHSLFPSTLGPTEGNQPVRHDTTSKGFEFYSLRKKGSEGLQSPPQTPRHLSRQGSGDPPYSLFCSAFLGTSTVFSWVNPSLRRQGKSPGPIVMGRTDTGSTGSVVVWTTE